MIIYTYNPPVPEAIDPETVEPEVFTCSLCGEYTTEGKRITFATHTEIACNECLNEPDYIELIASKDVKRIEKLN